MPATPERAAFVAQEFRSATWQSDGVRTNYGRVARDTKDQPFETFFDDPLHAQVMLNERGVLLGGHARLFRATIDDIMLEDQIDLSQVIPSARLIDDELAADLTVAIAALQSVDFDAERTILNLWGNVGPVPVSYASAIAIAAGTGAAAATGATPTIHAGAGSASGSGSASGDGASVAPGAGSAAGSGSASGEGGYATSDVGVGSASGSAAASGTGASIAAGAGSASGTGAATATGSNPAAFAYQDVTTTKLETTSTSFVMNRPATYDEGDYFLAVMGAGTSTGMSPPSGWEELGVIAGDTQGSAMVFGKFAGASEPSTYTFTSTTSHRYSGAILRYKGVHPTRPINNIVMSKNASNSTSHVAPDVTAIDDGCELVSVAVGCWGGGYTYTPPGTLTEIVDNPNSGGSQIGSALGVGRQLLTAAGATGTRTWTVSTALTSCMASVLITPSGGDVIDRGLVQEAAGTRMETAGTSFVVNLPSGIASGDLLVAFINGGGEVGTQTVSGPAGWVELHDVAYNGTGGANAGGAAYYRVADGSEGSTATWTFGFSNDATAIVVRLRGQDATNPINVSATTSGTVNATNQSAPSVTTTASGCTLLTVIFNGWVTGMFLKPPSGHDCLMRRSQLKYGQQETAMAVGVEVLGAAGATGTRTWTCTPPTSYVAMSVAVKPV